MKNLSLLGLTAVALGVLAFAGVKASEGKNDQNYYRPNETKAYQRSSTYRQGDDRNEYRNTSGQRYREDGEERGQKFSYDDGQGKTYTEMEHFEAGQN